jgi:hypothetical protein
MSSEFIFQPSHEPGPSGFAALRLYRINPRRGDEADGARAREWLALHRATEGLPPPDVEQRALRPADDHADDTLRRRQAIRMGGRSINVTIGQYLDAVRAKSLIHVA